MDLPSLFGSAVRLHRKRLGISQEELAHRADLDRTFISGIERGVRNPSLRTVQRIADALGVGADTIFETMAELAAEASSKGQ